LGRWKDERICLRMFDDLLCFISIFYHQNQHQSHLDSRAKIIWSALLEKVEKSDKRKLWH
jgi:hypothetical protein